jgi:FkbM family methyltransferase
MHLTRDTVERSARGLLYGTPVFFPLRSCYQSILSRHKQARRRQMRAFYLPFVRRGDLVFDVGANVGTYSELFSELGAKVVAVEPNPRCCETLRRLARVRDVHVEECAIGDEPGKATLRICENSGVSTLTDRWYQELQRSPIHRDAKWIGELQIDVVTLDRMAERYGVPNFLKVDVEGYDDRVLRGMSFLPQFLSFEFNRLMPDIAMRCLEMENLRIDDLAGEDEFGDVLARRIA